MVDTAWPKADEIWQNVALKFTVKIKQITTSDVVAPTLLRVHFMRQDNLALGSLRGDYFLARYKKVEGN